MRNTQDYSLEEVEAIILAHHAKHLSFDKKTHIFKVSFYPLEMEDTVARVVTTPAENNGNKVANICTSIKQWFRRKVGERNTVNCSG